MKPCNAGLAELLASGRQFYKADLYTFTFVDGSVLRTTDADVVLVANTFTFPSCAPICERTKVSTKLGIEVDTMDVTIKPKPANLADGFAGDLLGGVTWPRAAREGYLDGAKLLVETAYLETWPVVVGTLHVFEGLLSDITPTRTDVAFTVKSSLELLSGPFPRDVYQSVCAHTVYDTGCALSKASFTATSTVSASPAATLSSIKTGLSQAAGYFDQGVLTFTSGALAGLKRTVKSYDGAGSFTFARPLPSIPATGVSISVFAGCDRRLTTCRTKFSNAGRFKGQPWVPTPETVR